MAYFYETVYVRKYVLSKTTRSYTKSGIFLLETNYVASFDTRGPSITELEIAVSYNKFTQPRKTKPEM